MPETESVLHDRDIREPLFDHLEECYGKCRILEEKNTGKARADVVMVTPQLLYGIEIKSDADTYARLERQVKYYNWYYDRNIVVVGSTHAHHIAEHVPAWWGIISAEQTEDGMDFYVIRKEEPNPKVNDEKKLSILWKRELWHLLELNHMPKYRDRSRQFIRKKLLERIPTEILWPSVMNELFERDYTQLSTVENR